MYLAAFSGIGMCRLANPYLPNVPTAVSTLSGSLTTHYGGYPLCKRTEHPVTKPKQALTHIDLGCGVEYMALILSDIPI